MALGSRFSLFTSIIWMGSEVFFGDVDAGRLRYLIFLSAEVCGLYLYFKD